MKEDQIQEAKKLTLGILHDLKDLVVDIQNTKNHVNRLEEHIGLLHCDLEDLREFVVDSINERSRKIKIPHRCPVCDGHCIDKNKRFCIPCDGNGIVWD